MNARNTGIRRAAAAWAGGSEDGAALSSSRTGIDIADFFFDLVFVTVPSASPISSSPDISENHSSRNLSFFRSS
ncbi:MAG: hypothetical protein R2855_01500 [Thermomicrobiales bacterium]